MSRKSPKEIEIDWQKLEQLLWPGEKAGRSRKQFVLPGRKHWVISDWVDLKAEAIVVDGDLGSIGIVIDPNRLEPIDEDAEEDVAARIRVLVDDMLRIAQALENRVTDSDKIEVLCVELIVLDPGDAQSPVIEALQKTIEDTMTTYSIGVNLWKRVDGDWLNEFAVRRAFPWALTHVRRWYDELSGSCSKLPEAKPVRMDELILDNFRLPGERVFEFSKERTLHVIHGFNGSGKSSLSEALEFLITGTVARVKRKLDHKAVLLNRGARSGAVVLKSAGKEVAEAKIHSRSAPRFKTAPQANAFRFNQVLSDDLSHGKPEVCARIFLEAFFPEAREQLLEEAKRRKEVETAAKQAGVDPDDPELDKKLRFLRAKVVKLDDLAGILPVETRPLIHLYPEICANWEEGIERSVLKEELDRLDEALDDLDANYPSYFELLEDEDGGNPLKKFERWRVGRTKETKPSTPVDYPGLVNRFLEAEALKRLYQRWREIVGVVKKAEENGWKPEDAEAKKLVEHVCEGVELADIENWEKAVIERYEKLEKEVMDNDPNAPNRSGGRKGKALSLTAAEEQSLNDFGALLRPDLDFGAGLGTKIREAIRTNKPQEIRAKDSGQISIIVGKSGWTKDLENRRKQLLYDLGSISPARLGRPRKKLADRLEPLRELLRFHEAHEEAEKEMADFFLQLIGRNTLMHALNEVMALCMPSRFAYRDLVAEYDEEKDRFRLLTNDEKGKQDEIEAALHFNTAELNLLSLALFLLCAPSRRDNPIRTIVLDDPFQNMDEMTVCTLARGLRRILRLWADHPTLEKWRILILLHSETDAARLEQEIACASYRLPWLASMEERVEFDPIEDESKFKGSVRVQSIDGLIEIATKS